MEPKIIFKPNKIKNPNQKPTLEISTNLIKERLKAKEKILIKLLASDSSSFLFPVLLKEIKEEDFGFKEAKRPMVIFKDIYENLEKAVWFYLYNVLPLVSEPDNFPASAITAKKYKIDYLILDNFMALNFLPYLDNFYPLKNIKKIKIIDSSFSFEEILKIVPKEKVVFSLSLPYLGVFANLKFSETEKNSLILEPKNSQISVSQRGLIVEKKKGILSGFLHQTSLKEKNIISNQKREIFFSENQVNELKKLLKREKNSIYGIQIYEPKSFYTKSLFLKITSSTTKKIPFMIIRELSNSRNMEKIYQNLLFLFGGVNLQASFLALMFFRIPGPKKLLFLDIKSLAKGRMSLVDFKFFSPEQIYAHPSAFSYLLDHKKFLKFSPKEIVLTGEKIETAHIQTIKKIFPKSKIRGMYALSEFGNVSPPQPDYLIKNYGYNAYCLLPSIKEIKILNPDKDGFGEIVISKKIARNLYLNNYRTGDLGKIIYDKNSPCFRKKILLLRGRANYDIVKCQGAIILKEELERVFNQFLAKEVKDFLAEIKEKIVADRGICLFSLKVVPKENRDLKNLKEKINNVLLENLFLGTNTTLTDLIKKGVFLPLQIDFLEEIKRKTPKKIRLRKI